VRLSQYPFTVRRETSQQRVAASDRLLTEAAMTTQIAAGLIAINPFLLRVLSKLEAIVREEMFRIGAEEVSLPVQPRELWDESGRWAGYRASDLMFAVADRQGREFCLAPTAEEAMTELARNWLRSYKQLPVNLFQIGPKFRDELRPRYGLLRAREFRMKDAYSFHETADDLRQEYERVREAYRAIFSRVKLRTVSVLADSGDMGGNASEEFMVESPVGENHLLICTDCQWAANVEKSGELDACPSCGHALRKALGIEVAHVFELDQRYTEPMNLSVAGRDGSKVIPVMGCYGLGLTRSLAAIVEVSHDKDGIVWPPSLEPFDAVLVPNKTGGETWDVAEKVYGHLLQGGFDVAFDDRELSFGVKVKDADAIGFPRKVIFGKHYAQSRSVEIVDRSGVTSVVPEEALGEFLVAKP
jgi:prolyl-tRNA synthetase